MKHIHNFWLKESFERKIIIILFITQILYDFSVGDYGASIDNYYTEMFSYRISFIDNIN